MAAVISQLPIIDMSKSRTDRKNLADTVVNALENVGFLFIDNVEGIDFDMLYKACEWFFSRPDEIKNALTRNHWNPNNKNIYRGYFPLKPNAPSRKEAFEFGRDINPDNKIDMRDNWFYEPSVWPKEDGAFPFKTFLTETYEKLHEASMEILRLTALGLGIDENSFEDIFSDKPCSTFRLIHYPPWDGSPPENAKIEDGKVVVTPDHTDSNFLTLLSTFHFKGLEVLSSDGKWIAIEPRPKSFVMNIGDVFSRMMGGRFIATRHRVIDIGINRFSVPFFLEPAYDGDIGLNFMSKATGKGPDHVVEKYGPWVIKTMKHEKQYVE